MAPETKNREEHLSKSKLGKHISFDSFNKGIEFIQEKHIQFVRRSSVIKRLVVALPEKSVLDIFDLREVRDLSGIKYNLSLKYGFPVDSIYLCHGNEIVKDDQDLMDLYFDSFSKINSVIELYIHFKQDYSFENTSLCTQIKKL